MRVRSWVFISNMFPAYFDLSYGVFVEKNFIDLKSQGLFFSKLIVIKGRRKGFLKFFSYMKYFSSILLLLTSPTKISIYSHYASHHCFALLVLSFIRRFDFIVNIHGDDLALAKASLARKILSAGQSKLLKRAFLIVVPSEYFKELLLKTYPTIKPANVAVSGSSGVDFDRFQQTIATENSFWICQQPMQRPINIGYIGRIDPDKGWHLLYDAFNLLKQKYNIRLHFWGAGSEQNKLVGGALESSLDRVFYHGAVSNDEISDVHRRIDILVVPSSRESLGLTALEGLASGRIIICSRIRPFTDFTENGISAFHFESGNSHSLKSAIEDVLTSDVEDLKNVSRNASNVARKFDRTLLSNRLGRLIAEKLTGNQ